jgi:hypothetical protein
MFPSRRVSLTPRRLSTSPPQTEHVNIVQFAPLPPTTLEELEEQSHDDDSVFLESAELLPVASGFDAPHPAHPVEEPVPPTPSHSRWH